MSEYTAPSAWSGRDHVTVGRRSRKGVATFERIAVSNAPVQTSGDPLQPAQVTDAEEAGSVEACEARRAVSERLADVRRLRLGLSAIDLEKLTNDVYGDLIPEAIGTGVTSYEEIVEGDRSSYSPVAYRTAGLSGGHRDPNVDAIGSPESVYRRSAAALAKWPTRRTLKIGRHRAADVRDACSPVMLRAVSEPFTTPVLATALRWHLVAPAADLEHRWQGHALVQRPAPRSKRSARADRTAATVANERRTIGTVAAPTTSEGWRELLDGLNRGERVKVTSENGRVTITRSAQRYEARDKRTGREHVWRVRSASSLAIALA